jgi:hypothetical protein
VWQTNTEPSDKVTNDIADTFATISSDPSLCSTPAEQTVHKTLVESLHTDMQSHTPPPFTHRELQQALRRANKRASSGPSPISTRLLLESLDRPAVSNALLCAINHDLLETLTFPDFLKTATIIPLPKNTPGEWRPISLLPALAKLIESMLEARLRHFLNPLLNPIQFGGRPGHSSAQAINRLFHAAGTAQSSSRYFAAIFYDFCKAYDRVPPPSLGPEAC